MLYIVIIALVKPEYAVEAMNGPEHDPGNLNQAIRTLETTMILLHHHQKTRFFSRFNLHFDLINSRVMHAPHGYDYAIWWRGLPGWLSERPQWRN